MDAAQRTARIAGVWFILTFAFSIPAALLYDPVLNDANYILGAGADAQVRLEALLEILTAIANIATAVVLFLRPAPLITETASGSAREADPA
ncbi:DUF4386 family protein [Actinomadura monticuli]|uniref:DUF4386 family protein n=1 Tax=Actinomadura monticuli TaxID=3097367 RepID=A0ABV4QR93_9ACTN